MYSKIQQYTCMCPKCSSFMSSKLNQILIILLVARSIILQLCDQTLFSNFVVDEEIFLPTSSLGSLTLTPLSKSFFFFFFLSSRVHIIYMLLCWLNERIHLHPRFPSRHKDLANLDQSRICLIIVIVIENYVHSSCIQVFLVP